MSIEKQYWDKFYNPELAVYWFQVPKFGSMKFKYDNIVQKNWGRSWYVPQETPIEQEDVILDEYVKEGSIILFGTPKKIVDLFLIVKVDQFKIDLSPVFFSMLWKDLKIIPPIPSFYQSPHRNYPVKIDDDHKIHEQINDKLFEQVYGF